MIYKELFLGQVTATQVNISIFLVRGLWFIYLTIRKSQSEVSNEMEFEFMPTRKVVKWNKTSYTSIEDFKYLPSSVSIQFKLQLSLKSTQSQFNSTSTKFTELGTTQLKLVNKCYQM